jgi:hypothetical protein
MKRFRRIALLAAAVLVCATCTASARGRDKQQVRLYPPAGSPFLRAGGSITLTLSKPPVEYWLNNLSVSKLTPTTRYHMPVYVYDPNLGWTWSALSFKTDTRGNGNVSGGFLTVVAYGFEVYDSSSGTLVLTSK